MASFAVNGVMVFVVFICLAVPRIAPHSIKINLSIFLAALLTILLPITVKIIPDQTEKFWVAIVFMFFIGVAMALALAQTLSYMSFMPERYMALNSMGIGFSGLVSLGIYGTILLCLGSPDEEFKVVMIANSLCSILMLGIAAIYFFERKSPFAQYYIKLAGTDIFSETISTKTDEKKRCSAVRALWTNSKVPLLIAWPMLFQVFFGMTLSFLVIPGVLESRPITFIKNDDWNNVLIIGLFNVFDTLGRSIGGYPPLMISMEKTFQLHLLAFSRILIVMLAIMIEVGVFSENQTA